MQITSLNISSSLNQVAEKIRDKVSQASNIRQRTKKKLTTLFLYLVRSDLCSRIDTEQYRERLLFFLTFTYMETTNTLEEAYEL